MTLEDNDFYVECYVKDRIITLKELKYLQQELKKIKGYFFEIHTAVTSE